MFSELSFQGRWRDYQGRVLDELAAHLGDERLHVVAAPGSGKTVLGLEVVRRIARPALILAPTVAIRNQWVERLRGLFLPPGAPRPAWISTALARPKPLTVATYQALFAAMKGAGPATDEAADDAPADDEPATPGTFEALAAFYNKLGPATLVLDEAHHLRREWWKALTALQEALPAPQIVALTATPPYDVEIQEWQRYEALCGDIDAEIPVAELVKNGDLCPHQDYVHFSLPTHSEDALIAAHRDGLAALIAALHGDRGFLAMLLAHPWMTAPQAHEEAILDAPEFLSAMLVFAAFAGAAPPRAPLDLLGLGGSEIPLMTLHWLELLLDGMLFDHEAGFAHEAGRLAALRAELRRLDAIEGKKVRLVDDRSFYATLAGSLAKIDSIAAIAAAEAAALGDRLRMVVLADYVRAEQLPRAPGDSPAPTRLGVVPIFEALRRRALPGARLGVLTGTLVVIPAAALAALGHAAAEAGIDPGKIRHRPLPHDPDFLRIEPAGEAGQRIVQLVTALFDAGEINLLTGTQALLGEGWDAPTINALILASYVGSYMLSNQMRGRAIRIDPDQPDKTANIWHLATILPDTLERRLTARFAGRARPDEDPFDPLGRDLGPDMEMLKRRFLAFEGVAHRVPPRIENGLARLSLPDGAWDEAGVARLNAEMLARAAEGRGDLRERWQAALIGRSERPRMRRAARLNYTPRTIAILDTLGYLAVTGLLGGLAAAGEALLDPRMPSEIGLLIAAFVGLGFLYAVPKLGKALYLLVRNGTLEASLDQVGAVILDCLEQENLLTLWRGDMWVETSRGPLGEALVRLEGAGRAEERLFLEALAEVLGPIGNPRYLIVRQSWLGRRSRTDYHAVPALFGRKKHLAEYFCARWNRRVGSGRLVYLRNAPGRRLLLRARTRSLAAGFQRFVGSLSLWR